MKRTALALTLIVTILVLSCSMVIGMHTACFVQANFMNEPQKISVILLSPENKSYAPDNLHLTFRVSHWYNANIDTWLTLDNQAPVRLYLSNYQGSVGEGEYDSSITGLKDGSHVIKIRASSGEDYNEGQVFFTIDSTPPTISNISVENMTYSKTDLTLNCTINERTSWIAYSLDNQANVTIKGYIITERPSWMAYGLDDRINVTMQGNTTLTDLAEGSHSLIIYANDTAGNIGASETITFTIATPESFPIMPVTASIATVTIVSVGLLVYFKKRGRGSNP
jgi:hypothetical protein